MQCRGKSRSLDLLDGIRWTPYSIQREEKNGVPFVTFISTFQAASRCRLNACHYTSYDSIPSRLRSGLTSYYQSILPTKVGTAGDLVNRLEFLNTG